MNGHFREVFDILSKLHEKNSFSLAIILGDLFANLTEATPEDEENLENLLSGKISIPLSTYFTIGRHQLPPPIIKKIENSDGEIIPNLYFWNKRSINKISEGLRIVNLAGTLDPAITAGQSKDNFLPFHTEDDANSLRGANSADILITTNWPLSIDRGSQVKLSDESKIPILQAQQSLADLCLHLKPKYHFSTSNELFFEREPFFHLSDRGTPEPIKITRFISLAAFGNPHKQKWLYAFNIDPHGAPLSSMPPGTTPCPLISSRKRQLPDEIEPYSRYSSSQQDAVFRPRKRARRREAPPTPRECFFCLSSPTVATHLIVSIADDTYLATAKGPLTTSSSFSSFACPAHILIIPLSHAPTLRAIPDPAVRGSTYREMQRYRRSLHNLLIDKCKDTMGAVTWEVSRTNGVHVHWQFLPVAINLIKQGLVEAAFKVEAENEHYPSFTSKDIGDGETTTTSDHFRVWIWWPKEGITKIDAVLANPTNGSSPTDVDIEADGEAETRGKEKSLVLSLTPEIRFDVQFGRRVMAKLLQVENRMDWRACAQSEAEESADAEVFKTAFARWDFSREEE